MTSQEDKLSDMNSGSELGWDYSGATYSLCIAPHCATVLEGRVVRDCAEAASADTC